MPQRTVRQLDADAVFRTLATALVLIGILSGCALARAGARLPPPTPAAIALAVPVLPPSRVDAIRPQLPTRLASPTPLLASMLVKSPIPAVIATGAPTRPVPPTFTLAQSLATLTPEPAPAMSPAPRPTPPVTPSVVVFIDPGHGGVDSGGLGSTVDGNTVAEKDLALAIARRTANQLAQDGVTSVMSRTDDSLPGIQPADYTADGLALTPDGVLADLQRRIDRANASGAQVYLSIHLNAYSDPSVSGAETFYDGARPYANQNLRLAGLLQSNVITAFRAQGFDTPDRGVADDQALDTTSVTSLVNYDHFVILGPGVPGRMQPTMMPAAISEPLFLSNPTEATAATLPATQDALASAYRDAIEQFLGIVRR